VPGVDAWLPQYGQREYHERHVHAPPEEALDAALGVPVEADPVVRALFRARGVEARGKTLAEFFAPPWAEVLERTPTSFVVRVDRPSPRVVFDLLARPADDGGSILSTETRVAGGGLPFRLYWLVVGPFSALIRRRWLIAAARRAAALSPNAR
jgi:hypothetical protein